MLFFHHRLFSAIGFVLSVLIILILPVASSYAADQAPCDDYCEWYNGGWNCSGSVDAEAGCEDGNVLTCYSDSDCGNSNYTCNSNGVCSDSSSSSYYCESGYYLANYSTSCDPCPSGYYCGGGTYDYSGSSQGLTKCPTSYPSSDSMNYSINYCYNTNCGTNMSGRNYYNGTSTCSGTACNKLSNAGATMYMNEGPSCTAPNCSIANGTCSYSSCSYTKTHYTCQGNYGCSDYNYPDCSTYCANSCDDWGSPTSYSDCQCTTINITCNSGYSKSSSNTCDCTTPCTSAANRETSSGSEGCSYDCTSSIANAASATYSGTRSYTNTCSSNYTTGGCKSAGASCSGCSSWTRTSTGSCGSGSCTLNSCNSGYYKDGNACYCTTSCTSVANSTSTTSGTED
ncbi:MAG: hypothetical protein IKJ62_00105, partial [Alphaproteobacteria bacterium]|nr:hypothetical protein [Alphaproteobacteria bacterium]